MAFCSACGHQNDDGRIYCTECGNLLREHFAGYSDALTGITSDASLRLMFIFSRNSVSIPVREGSELILGRQAQNATKSLMSRIDAVENSLYYAALKGQAVNLSISLSFFSLVPFGANVAGVSRSHAVIRREYGLLTIEDLGSSHGTHLNGQRIVPGDVIPLNYINELRLGHLEFTLRLSMDTVAL